MFSLKNKVALVIGGKGKIGLEISYSLAMQGANVIVASKSSQISDAVKKGFQKYNIKFIQMDASNEEDVLKVVNDICSEEGEIEILVNASAWRPLQKFMDDTIENWNKSVMINSSAIFIPSRIVGKRMALNKKGSVINISSIYGITAPQMQIYQDCDFETEPDYPFLKAGCIGLTKYFSSYFAKNNVRFNIVAPGGVSNNQPKEFTERYIERVPMNRMASAKDIAGAVVFLASDASSYITGVVLPIDGGWTAV